MKWLRAQREFIIEFVLGLLFLIVLGVVGKLSWILLRFGWRLIP